MHGQAVIAGTDDAGDVIGGFAGDNALQICVIVVHQVEQAGACGLGVGHIGKIPFIGFAQHVEEVSRGGVCFQTFIAPGSGSLGNVRAVARCDAVVSNLLSESCAGLIQVFPECLLRGFVPLGEVGIVAAGGNQQVEQGVHTGSVLAHAFDRDGINGGAAVIGRISQNIDAEDDVIDVRRGAVGELDVVAHGQIVIDRAVGVLNDLDIAHGVVSIVGAVVGDGLALDALADDVALAVRGQQAALRQVNNFLVISSRCKERAELLTEGSGGVNQRIGLFGLIRLGRLAVVGLRGVGGSLSAAFAAGEQRNDHHESQNESEKLHDFLVHFLSS